MRSVGSLFGRRLSVVAGEKKQRGQIAKKYGEQFQSTACHHLNNKGRKTQKYYDRNTVEHQHIALS